MSKTPPEAESSRRRYQKLGLIGAQAGLTPTTPEERAQLRERFARFVDHPETREKVEDSDQESQASALDLPTAEESYEQPHRSASESTVKDSMSKPVLFYGKASQIDPCMTFCTVKFLADNVSSGTAKSGYLASCFRGSALSWLSRELEKNPALLQDYDRFVATVKREFDLDPAAKNGQAARQLASLRQKSSVHDYAQKFSALSNQLEIPDSVAIANFTKGLKRHIRTALIINDERTTLADAIAEATRIDSQLYYAQPRTQGFGKPKGSTRDRKGRFSKSTGIKSENYEY